MEKRLRSSLQTSADAFLSSAIKLTFKSAKPSLKTLIHNIKPSSDLCTSIPLYLHSSISKSINSFKNPSSNPPTPSSPPSKKLRRPSRNSHSTTSQGENPQETLRNSLLSNLQIYAHIALLCVKHPKGVFSHQDLFPAVQELHDNLILFESDSVLLSEISNLCEEWWKGEFVGREMLISQFLPFLVSRSLTLRKKVDVRRVYALRDAFMLFDFEDESIEDLKLLLVRCVITPLYLKTEDGRKFIAFIFGLSMQLLKESLALIKSQIPFGRKSMLEAYGEIVFRGWKSVDGDLRTEIELGFLQGLIEGATLANSPSLAASIRRVLGAFTNHRTVDGVEKLLFRLVEPLIFRSLQVANSNVRHNALHLFLDVFPLEDPDATKESKDTLLDKQFFLLEKLLKDSCPEVRLVAVEGCCRILHLFWEIIPSSTITKMITIIFDDMTRDVSNEVRLSTLNGISYLIGNPQAHELLKVLLPRLGNMILDPCLPVRVALADLLLLIMDVRGFQFNKVVSLDVLLTTLENDQPPVAQKITQLLLPSYFPSKVDKAEACTRFVTLVKRAPMSGARLCEFAGAEGASSKYLLELVRVLMNLVLSPDTKDADLNKGIFVALSHLCSTLMKESSARVALKDLFSGERLKGLLSASTLGNARSSLFEIISVVSPPVTESGLFRECMSFVTNCRGLSQDIERQAEVRSAHKLVVAANRFDDMFEALTALLQETAVECGEYFSVEVPRELIPSTKRKKTGSVKMSGKGKRGDGKRPVTFKDKYQNAVGIAWQIKDLLSSESSRKAMSKSKAFKMAVASLKLISEVSFEHCACCDFIDSSLVDAYMALSLLISVENISADDVGEHSNRKTKRPESGSSLEQVALVETLDHLLSCAERVLSAGGLAKFGSMFSGCKQCEQRTSASNKKRHVNSRRDASSSSDDGSGFSYRTRILNIVKILTAVLKFIVDIAALKLLSQDDQQSRCLRFTSAYLQNMISTLKRTFNDELKFEEEQVGEIHACLKSSFSYGAKLLNAVLAGVTEDSPAPPDAYDVANHLLNLTASSELYCGPVYASRLVTLAKQWLPDVILGLGSRCILKDSSLEDIVSQHVTDEGEMHIHPWVSILANIEFHEMMRRAATLDEEEDDKPDENEEKLPAFRKLTELMIQVLRMNHEMLDIVGLIFLIGSATGLQTKDFCLASGLVHFVFIKLVRHDETETYLGKLPMISAYLQQQLYPRFEACLEEADDSTGDDELQQLACIKDLLEPVWLYSCQMKDDDVA